MTITRFTKHLVSEMLYAVLHHHGQGDEYTKHLHTAIEIGASQGRGVRYMMGMDRDVQLGGKGARRAVAYCYGLGEGAGAWRRLNHLAETSDKPYARFSFRRVQEVARAACEELGHDEFYAWVAQGREYALKDNLFSRDA